MAAPHYAEILTGGPRPKFGEPPARLLTGAWKLWYIPNDDSSYGSARTLVWVKKSGGGEAFSLTIVDDGGCKVRVAVDGVVVIDRPITFSGRSGDQDPGQRMRFTLDGEAGTLAIAGATTGNGTFEADDPWEAPSGGGEFRIGTADSAANPARGYVSLPYG